MQSPDVVHPGLALAVFALLCAAMAVLFWPRHGLAARIVRVARLTERVRLEDALKQLYRCEYEGRPGSVELIAGTLDVPRARAVKLLSRLEQMRLIRADGDGFPLTDDGRAYALRVLRTHRLWERYLADRTGLSPELWHEEAEQKEHALSPADAETLAASLGHPLYDPHGDPIPTAAGDLPPKRGVALTTLAAGDTAVISHLEDEPAEVYQRLIAEHLAPHMRLEVLESPEGQVHFRTERGTHAVEPVIANNVTVERVEGATPAGMTLADAELGEPVRVVRLSPACEGAQRRRLLDLGVVPGTVIKAEFRGLGTAGATAYRIREALIALRAEQAAWIHVARISADFADSAEVSDAGDGSARGVGA